MKAITFFEADDKTRFDTQQDCENYELLTKAITIPDCYAYLSQDHRKSLALAMSTIQNTQKEKETEYETLNLSGGIQLAIQTESLNPTLRTTEDGEDPASGDSSSDSRD